MITYPVSPSDRFVFYRKSTLEILAKGVQWPRADGMPLSGSNPDIAPLLIFLDPTPSFNPDTQKIVSGEQPNFAAEEYHYTKTVVALSGQELLDAQERAQARQAYNDLKNGTGTDAVRLRRVELVLAYLMRFLNQNL